MSTKRQPEQPTEHDAQIKIFHATPTKDIVIPNFTPHGWWECDVARYTEKGHLIEYEIKTSLADFRKDAKKKRPSRWNRKTRTVDPPVSKHEQLAAKHDAGPRQFYFVVPKGLIQEEDVPEWAGLQYFDHGWQPTVIKRAPILNRTPATEEVRRQARDVFYWRFWSLKDRVAAE